LREHGPLFRPASKIPICVVREPSAACSSDSTPAPEAVARTLLPRKSNSPRRIRQVVFNVALVCRSACAPPVLAFHSQVGHPQLGSGRSPGHLREVAHSFFFVHSAIAAAQTINFIPRFPVFPTVARAIWLDQLKTTRYRRSRAHPMRSGGLEVLRPSPSCRADGQADPKIPRNVSRSSRPPVTAL